MARFDRKVERQKKEFDFYHKEKTKKSKMTEFKDKFTNSDLYSFRFFGCKFSFHSFINEIL